MPSGRSQAFTALKVVCEPADGETISAHGGAAQILLTFFGADVKRRQAEIRKMVEQAAQAPLDGAYVRKVVEAAGVAVRRNRALGVKQGASLAVAYVAPAAGAEIRVHYFALGDCSIWLVRPGEAQLQPALRRTYLGELGTGVDDLMPRGSGQFTVDPTARAVAVLAPAHYRVEPPAPPRALASLLAVLSTGLAAAILIFLGLPGLGALQALFSPNETPAPSAALLSPTGTRTNMPASATPTPEGGVFLTFTPVPSAAVAPGAASKTPVPPDVLSLVVDVRATQVAKITAAHETSQALQTAQARPTSTPTPLATATPAPTEAPALSRAIHGVSLLRPPDGLTSDGLVEFEWLPGQPLPSGIVYELVIQSRSGGNPQGAYRASLATTAKVDLSQLFAKSEFSPLLNNGPDLCWGVRAWNTEAKEPSILLSECRALVFGANKSREPSRPTEARPENQGRPPPP